MSLPWTSGVGLRNAGEGAGSTGCSQHSQQLLVLRATCPLLSLAGRLLVFQPHTVVLLPRCQKRPLPRAPQKKDRPDLAGRFWDGVGRSFYWAASLRLQLAHALSRIHTNTGQRNLIYRLSYKYFQCTFYTQVIKTGGGRVTWESSIQWGRVSPRAPQPGPEGWQWCCRGMKGQQGDCQARGEGLGEASLPCTHGIRWATHSLSPGLGEGLTTGVPQASMGSSATSVRHCSVPRALAAGASGQEGGQAAPSGPWGRGQRHCCWHCGRACWRSGRRPGHRWGTHAGAECPHTPGCQRGGHRPAGSGLGHRGFSHPLRTVGGKRSKAGSQVPPNGKAPRLPVDRHRSGSWQEGFPLSGRTRRTQGAAITVCVGGGWARPWLDHRPAEGLQGACKEVRTSGGSRGELGPLPHPDEELREDHVGHGAGEVQGGPSVPIAVGLVHLLLQAVRQQGDHGPQVILHHGPQQLLAQRHIGVRQGGQEELLLIFGPDPALFFVPAKGWGGGVTEVSASLDSRRGTPKTATLPACPPPWPLFIRRAHRKGQALCCWGAVAGRTPRRHYRCCRLAACTKAAVSRGPNRCCCVAPRYLPPILSICIFPSTINTRHGACSVAAAP